LKDKIKKTNLKGRFKNRKKIEKLDKQLKYLTVHINNEALEYFLFVFDKESIYE
jgi:hypothetical protein